MTEQTQTETRLAENLEKRVFVGFAGIVTMGLFLGGWYVSSRMLVAGKPPAITRAELPLPPVSAPEREAQPASGTAKRVTVHAGETYLQLAAMGPRATEKYLEELGAKGIHPLIGPGPSETISRILMGPYPTSSELQKAQTALEGQGIQTMVRVY